MLTFVRDKNFFFDDEIAGLVAIHRPRFNKASL